MKDELIENKVLKSYGFEYVSSSWMNDDSDGPGYWRSATHKVIKHEDDRYTIFQFREIS